jgi:uncharacterized protein with GYD domain
MHFVLLASHNAEVCPTSNSTMRDLMLKRASQVPEVAKRLSVNVVAGPFVNREHLMVVVVEAERAEAVDRFLMESGLAQWNSVRVLPSLPLEQGLKDAEEMTPIF